MNAQKYSGRTCKICGAIFETKSGCISHEKSCSKFKTSSRKCDHCEKTFYRYAEYKNHMDYVNGKLRVNCKICKKSLCDKTSLRKHMKAQHPNNQPIPEKPDDWFECEVTGCKKRFKTKADLSRHKSFHTGERRVTCYVCQVSCYDRGTFLKHLKVQHLQEHQKKKLRDKQAEKKRKLEKANSLKNNCVFCGKKCGKPSALIQHLLVHTEERPFICKICGKEYGRNNTLGRHYIKEHGQKGLRLSKSIKLRVLQRTPPKLQYSCSVCWTQNLYPRRMMRHVVKVHGADAEIGKTAMMNQKKKPFIRNGPRNGCYVCGKRFYCRTMTRIHVEWCERDHGIVLKDNLTLPKHLEFLKKPKSHPGQLNKKARQTRKAK